MSSPTSSVPVGEAVRDPERLVLRGSAMVILVFLAGLSPVLVLGKDRGGEEVSPPLMRYDFEDGLVRIDGEGGAEGK